jgi:hypothetical protein
MIIIAAIIGVLVAASEIMSHYPKSRFVYLWNTLFLFYLLINAAFASAAYMLMPQISRNELFAGDSSFMRPIIAGLGCSAILRMKFGTFKIGARNLSAGPAFIYETANDYLLRHINITMNIKKLTDANFIAELYPAFDCYVLPVNLLCFKMGEKGSNTKEEQAQVKALRDELIKLSNDKVSPGSQHERLVKAALLVIDHFGNKKMALTILKIFKKS